MTYVLLVLLPAAVMTLPLWFVARKLRSDLRNVREDQRDLIQMVKDGVTAEEIIRRAQSRPSVPPQRRRRHLQALSVFVIFGAAISRYRHATVAVASSAAVAAGVVALAAMTHQAPHHGTVALPTPQPSVSQTYVPLPESGTQATPAPIAVTPAPDTVAVTPAEDTSSLRATSRTTVGQAPAVTARPVNRVPVSTTSATDEPVVTTSQPEQPPTTTTPESSTPVPTTTSPCVQVPLLPVCLPLGITLR